MIRFFYNLISYLAVPLERLLGLFNQKLKLGSTGRDASFGILESNIKSSDRIIWMHVASLGEFEQGRPVLERLKSSYPDHKILLSFFSPSGYEIRKDYQYADIVSYLPIDTPANAKRFLKLTNPEIAIFVKYEFWPNYLEQIKRHNCKAILISTVIQPDNEMLKYQQSWFVDLMNAFDHILTQDQSTYDLLDALNIRPTIKVSGDTRIDRTIAIAEKEVELPAIAQFCGSDKVLIAGSTWPEDETNLLQLLESDKFKEWKLIIAPHDISTSHLDQIMMQFDGAIRYTQMDSPNVASRVLVIDNIGLLNKIYRYGNIAYIGGGFGSGIHNTLEPAAYSLPIIFGPKYDKFVEANQLVESGGAFTYSEPDILISIFQSLQEDTCYTDASVAVMDFMDANLGATDDVMETISKVIVI